MFGSRRGRRCPQVGGEVGNGDVDLVPDASSAEYAARVAWFYDPGPMTQNVYADLLKIVDSSGARLPFEVTDLPSPEFVAASLSKFGVGFTIDPYYMAMDLHSPTGIALPLMVGAVIAAQQEQARARSIHRPRPKPTPTRGVVRR